MLIDWFTVIAQVINFLILAWLLKRFLYRPILNAIDAREQRIATELADAAKKSIEAEQQRDEFQHKNAAFNEEKMNRKAQLAAEIETARTRLLEEARQESDNLRNTLQLALKNDQLSLQGALSLRAREELLAIVRKVLKDLAEISLEEQITAVFIQRLKTLSNEELTRFASAFQYRGAAFKNPLIIRSAFTLSKELCEQIETALKNILCHYTAVKSGDENSSYISDDTGNTYGTSNNAIDQIALKFVIDPALISGIEINANGQKIAWSINDYLASLTKSIDEILHSLGSAQTGGATEATYSPPAAKKNKQDDNEARA